MARGGVDPVAATMTLAEYGDAVMSLAVRGLEAKTLDPYLAGWRKRVVPSLGHLPVRMITNGAVDRVVHAWIAEECSRSTVNKQPGHARPGDGAGRPGWHHRPQPRQGDRLAARVPARRGRAGQPRSLRCLTGTPCAVWPPR